MKVEALGIPSGSHLLDERVSLEDLGDGPSSVTVYGGSLIYLYHLTIIAYAIWILRIYVKGCTHHQTTLLLHLHSDVLY